MKRLRPLIIAEAANPEWISVPLVGWSLANSVAARTNGHLVTHVRNREALVRAGLEENKDFTAIDNESVAAPAWKLTEWAMKYLKLGYTVTQISAVVPYLYFEYLVWQKFKDSLLAGEWDLVHRITPLSPTTPSLLPRLLKNKNVPFVLGPLNGGVPWPPGFTDVRNAEGDFFSAIRAAHRFLPLYSSTRTEAAAILAGSRYTFDELPEEVKEKAFYLPENAVDPTRFALEVLSPAPDHFSPDQPLRICFLGRLVPYKSAHLLIRAALPFLREGRVAIDIIGEGPEAERLKSLITQEDVRDSVTLSGWVSHKELRRHLAGTHVLGFPSIREFGGGVVLEAMALGIVPVVANYAGPSELVTDSTGFRVDFSNEQDLVDGFSKAISKILENPGGLKTMQHRAVERVKNLYTWDKKASQLEEIYHYVLGNSSRPTFSYDD